MEEQDPPPRDSNLDPVPRCSGESILVVEDDEPVRLTAIRILERLGYQLHDAASGAAALEMVDAQGFVPDLLLTDVVMPGMNGKELHRELSRRIPALKVLYASGQPR